MRRRGWWAVALFVAAAVIGCQADKYDPSVPLREEWRPVPDEDRYNHPEERGWKPPPPKKEFKPGVGGPGSPGGPAGSLGGGGGPGF